MKIVDSFDRLAGAVIVGGFDGLAAPEVLRERLAQGLIAGVTLFKRNVADPLQVAQLVASLVDAARPSGTAPLVSIDQEGGRVARLRASIVQLPAMRVLGERDDPALTRGVLAALARGLVALGCTTDFAPVADVDSNPDNPIIGDRAFSRDPARVAAHVVAAIEGLQGAGVAACAKHFPGHGDTAQDSHLDLPVLRHGRARIDAIELVPFRAAISARVASIMTAHVVFEGIDAHLPATLSKDIVGTLLREELGFEGVCFSDDLHMKAVADRYSIEECSVRSIEAGCDALLICTDLESQDRAQRALAARARINSDFAARLHEAGERLRLMRTRYAPQPVLDGATLLGTLQSREDHAFVDALIAS
ncbi:MAG: beta-N-acetylhexosaminidase [Deltaproteobacteria bacterium]|nr:beta-N-acetylhexosaminidase [Deltaproteobacteria bacterium]